MLRVLSQGKIILKGFILANIHCDALKSNDANALITKEHHNEVCGSSVSPLLDWIAWLK